MKILHLTTYRQGGAGIAAQRLVAAERGLGIDAELKTGIDLGIDPLLQVRNWNTLPHVIVKRLEREIIGLQKTTNPVHKHSLGLHSLGFVDAINANDADIVHLHWINDGFLSVSDIPKIRKPLVWTMHDNWVFCGAEHCVNLLEDDHRYRDGYTCKNHAPSSSGVDVDRWIWNWKMRCWRNLQCTFTAPSRWLTKLFHESAFGKGRTCVTIPNCIPMDVFCPGDKTSARRQLGIPANDTIIAFGAMSADDPNKGLSRALEALTQIDISRRANWTLLVFGHGDIKSFSRLGCRIVSVGEVTTLTQMASIYRAADVFICPSIIESFSLTCAEALSSGTPAVAFDASGTTDVIEHLKSGYLAKSFDVTDFAKGICYCLDHSVEMASNCRQSSEDKCSGDRVATAFKSVYQGILENRQ